MVCPKATPLRSYYTPLIGLLQISCATWWLSILASASLFLKGILSPDCAIRCNKSGMSFTLRWRLLSRRF